MEIKAFFFDIDGTFYDHVTNCVLPETLTAVKQLKANGYKVALCSGRAYEMAHQLGMIDLFDWDGYVGGAGVSVYNSSYETIYEDFFTPEQTKEIFSLGKLHNVCINSHGKHEFMTLPLNAYAKQTFDEFHCQVPVVREWKNEALVAISAYEKPGYDWSVFAHIDGIELQFPNDTCVDFMKTNTNKATGIAHLMKYWGYEPNAYIAFGDSMNDKQMIQEAAIGFVMGNGSNDLKPFADSIIGPSNEPSIYETLLKLGYIS